MNEASSSVMMGEDMEYVVHTVPRNHQVRFVQGILKVNSRLYQIYQTLLEEFSANRRKWTQESMSTYRMNKGRPITTERNYI
jgi:hypothetical protein